MAWFAAALGPFFGLVGVEAVADVAEALSGDGTVKLRLAGSSTVELEVPDSVRCEAEVEVDGDEIELEFELKWSTAPAAPDVAKKDGAAPKKEAAAARK